MKKLIAVLLLLIIGESAYAEYVTILPVNSQTVANASSEIITLSELYGKTTTIRYITDSTSPEFVALNNTNIYPSDTLTLTQDVLLDNKLFGFYVGAARQVKEASEPTAAASAMTLSFTDSEIDYQALMSKAKSEAGSNIALAKIIEEQINRSNASELLTLNDDSESDPLTGGDNSSFVIDSFISGSSSSNDLDLPTGDNILISGLGGAILSGGSGGSGGVGFADGGANVPEPSTWLLLILGISGLAIYRKRLAR